MCVVLNAVSDIEVLDKVPIDHEQARIALVSFPDSFTASGSGHKTRISPGHARTHGTNLEEQRQRKGRGEVTVSDYVIHRSLEGGEKGRERERDLQLEYLKLIGHVPNI